MNREDIIRLVRQAANEEMEIAVLSISELEKYTALVEAAEREACAKVCEEMRTYVGRNNAVTQSSAQDCATAIQARGDNK